jgi:hypothetical protein
LNTSSVPLTIFPAYIAEYHAFDKTWIYQLLKRQTRRAKENPEHVLTVSVIFAATNTSNGTFGFVCPPPVISMEEANYS